MILTKDSKLLTNQLEIIALLRSGAATFALRAADMSGPEMAEAFVAALPDMLKFINKFDLPFLATISRSGNVSISCHICRSHQKGRLNSPPFPTNTLLGHHPRQMPEISTPVPNRQILF